MAFKGFFYHSVNRSEFLSIKIENFLAIITTILRKEIQSNLYIRINCSFSRNEKFIFHSSEKFVKRYRTSIDYRLCFYNECVFQGNF